MALDERTRSAVLGKYGRMHVNSAEDGTDIDEVMTVVSGGPFRWGFTLKDGSIARFQIDKVGLQDKAVRDQLSRAQHARRADGCKTGAAGGLRPRTQSVHHALPGGRPTPSCSAPTLGRCRHHLPPPPARCSKPVRAIWRRGPGPAACFMPAMPAVTGRGARGPSPLFRLRLCRARHAPEGHDPGRSATGNSLSGGGWGGHPGDPHYCDKVRNDGAIIYQ